MPAFAGARKWIAEELLHAEGFTDVRIFPAGWGTLGWNVPPGVRRRGHRRALAAPVICVSRRAIPS